MLKIKFPASAARDMNMHTFHGWNGIKVFPRVGQMCKFSRTWHTYKAQHFQTRWRYSIMNKN